jgi:DNA topoisomerase-1
MLVKEGRFGKYLACSAYPGCRNIQPLVKPKSTGIACPACREGELQEKKSRYGKIFYSCNRYPQCKYAVWDRPVAEPCPKCSFPLTVVKESKREGTVRRCPQEGCDFKQVLAPPEKAEKAVATPSPRRKAAAAAAGAKRPRQKKS